LASALRASVTGVSVDGGDLITLGAWAAVVSAAALRWFRWE
jgi:hypothetical protein